jgi:NADH-quinone oxidoreductase subunit N
MLNSLDSYAWMRSDPLAFSFLRGAGLLMIALGSAWCLAERRAPRIVAYALLVDFGVSLLALSATSAGGYATALGMAGARAMGAVVWALGFSSLSDGSATDQVRTAGQTPPRRLAAITALAGALSLAGLPLTAGFAGRWMTLAALPGDTASTIAIVSGVVAVGYSSVRWARGLTAAGSDTAAPLPRGRRALLLIGLAAILILAVVPAWLYAWTLPALAGMSGILPPTAP